LYSFKVEFHDEILKYISRIYEIKEFHLKNFIQNQKIKEYFIESNFIPKNVSFEVSFLGNVSNGKVFFIPITIRMYLN
jgi:hypothetical protein